MRKNLLVGRGLGTAGHHEQLPGIGYLVRDPTDRHAVQKTIDQPVRIVGRYQFVNGRRFREEIADGDAPSRRLRARETDRHAARRDRIVADDDERAVAVECCAKVATGGLPVEPAPARRCRHGEPTVT